MIEFSKLRFSRRAFAVLTLGIGAIMPAGTVFASDQPTYVFSSWQAGWVGDCIINQKHMTADCEPAPGLNGSRLSAKYVEMYLNNQLVPGAPVGKRLSVMIKLREPVQGLPPDAALAEITELHLHDLQRKYYPRAAVSAKFEGNGSTHFVLRGS